MKQPASTLTLYLDTTIPSYVFALDSPERMAITRRFMRLGRSEYEMVISDVVMEELIAAAEPKRTLLLDEVRYLPVLPMTPEARYLAQMYIQMKILPKRSWGDARHVALASLNKVDALVSWNFSHLVNVRRTKAINLLHASLGLSPITIITPEEVLE